jgi:predicted HicB family RNase H-like nuclease
MLMDDFGSDVDKGYTASVEFDPRDKIFVGRVLGIEDSITFHGETVAELTADFHAAIGHYLADCTATGRKPHKPYSGKLMLRIPPEVHAHAAMAAEAHGKSLNQWAAEVLARAS